MSIALIDRMLYWCSVNGVDPGDVALRDKGGGAYVPTEQPFTQEGLESIPDADIEVWLAEQKLTQLVAEIQRLAEDKVGYHIDPTEKPHWMGVADAFAKREAKYLKAYSLWLEESLFANIEERMPDEVTYPRPVFEDMSTWDNLEVIQDLTATIRDRATAMVDSLYQMTNVDILALPDDWVATHVLWP